MNKQTLKTTIMVKKEVEEPIEVQICPICGGTPRITYDEGIMIRSDNGEYMIGGTTSVVCYNCGLQARLQDWNKLYYEEDEQCK